MTTRILLFFQGFCLAGIELQYLLFLAVLYGDGVYPYLFLYFLAFYEVSQRNSHESYYYDAFDLRSLKNETNYDAYGNYCIKSNSKLVLQPN